MRIENVDIKKVKATVICKTCGKTFYAKEAYAGYMPKFCSRKCCSVSKIGGVAWNKGLKLSSEHRAALSDGRKKSEKCKGPNLYNWKGGKETEPARMKEFNKRRYHLVRGGGSLDTEYIKALKLVQHDRCFYCGETLKYDKKTHIEHLQPITKGGTNIWHNIVLSCQRCNNQKKNKTFTDFAIQTINPQWIDKSIILQSTAYKISRSIQNAAL